LKSKPTYTPGKSWLLVMRKGINQSDICCATEAQVKFYRKKYEKDGWEFYELRTCGK